MVCMGWGWGWWIFGGEERDANTGIGIEGSALRGERAGAAKSLVFVLGTCCYEEVVCYTVSPAFKLESSMSKWRG